MNLCFEFLFLILADFLCLSHSCGTLVFEENTVTEGGTATLIYTPNNIYVSSGRTWCKENPSASPTTLYNGRSISNIKYVEQEEEYQFSLLIYSVQQSDAGAYFVHCGTGFSNRANLNVAALNLEVSDVGTSCGMLVVEENNLTEKTTPTLIFTTQPGRVIAWQREINSSFVTLQRNAKYDIVQNQEKTIHNLWIFKAIYSDSGRYRVNCGGQLLSNTVELIIVPTAPTSPVFLDVDDIHECLNCIPAQLSVPVQVSCFVNDGSQPIAMYLYKDGIIINDVHKSEEIRNGITRTFLTYSFTPGVENLDTIFTCTVKNPALSAELAHSAKLYIKVDPKTINIDVKPVIENQTSAIHCRTTEGRPPMKSLIYLGKLTQKAVKISDITQTGHSYSVTTSVDRILTRLDNQKGVLCCSDVLTHKCSSSTTVDVKFPPLRVTVNEINKENQDNGDTELILRCSVGESNPKSSIEWKGVKNVPRKLTDKEYLSHTATHGWEFTTTWVFNLTKEDNYRQMNCHVQNPEFPDLKLTSSYRPNITYAPELTISGGENKTVFIGEDVYVTCHVESNPPSLITWQNETDQLAESDYGVNHLDLHLVNASTDDSQTYTCVARNGIGGVKTKRVILIVKDASETHYEQASDETDSSSVAGPVAGGAVVIIVAVIAVTAFLIIRKRKRNNSPSKKGSFNIKVEERKQSIHPKGNEPIYNNVSAPNNVEAVEEQPEYASVIPKGQRGGDDENRNEEGENSCEKGDNLVYAELDLTNANNDTAERSPVARFEGTEYVSIDFSKTGTIEIDES